MPRDDRKGPPSGAARREVRQAAARLQARGLVSLAMPSQRERLQEKLQDLRTQDTYDESTSCPACLEAQRRSGDVTALCLPHMQRALGF